ncbi:MAG: futalosine hydrolase [Polaribacter sp.]|jgi:futalosine hydrolase
MTVVIVSATPFEIAPLRAWLDEHFEEKEANTFVKGTLKIQCLITGVGQVKTAFHLATLLATDRADLYINAGIAGSYVENFPIGTVLNVIADRFGDLGVEESNGDFTDVHQMDLIPKDEFPFTKGLLKNPDASSFKFLPRAYGVTVNTVKGSQQNIDKVIKKYEPEVESMEGAAFAYACLQSGVNFLQIRAISNMVEPRNKENWDLPLAIGKLNEILIGILDAVGDARQIY